MSRELIEREASRRCGALLNDRYRLGRVIGSGGMGAVFDARDLREDRPVAVKLLLDVDGDARAAQRFAREARLLATLDHPNIVRVHDHGVDEQGTLFLVQDLLEGRDLRAHLRASGPLAPAEARDLLLPLLDALAHAHDAGVVHRDVKPENVFLDLRGAAPRPVLIDFGVARDEAADSLRSRSGAVIGTPVYMSPEQAAGRRPLDARSDVWSVGVVLFECLAGSAPFTGNYHEVLSALLTLDPPPLTDPCPDCPPSLRSLVARALQRDPDARHPTARALRDELARCDAPARPLRVVPRGESGTAAATERSTRRTAPPPASHRGRYASVAFGVAVALLLGTTLFARSQPAAPRAAPAPTRSPVAPTPPPSPPHPPPAPAPVVAAPAVEAPARARRVTPRPVAAPRAAGLGVNGAPLLSPYE